MALFIFAGCRYGLEIPEVFQHQQPIVVYFRMDEDALRGLDPRADPQLQRRVMLPIKFSKSTCIQIIFQKKDTCYPFDAFSSLICDCNFYLTSEKLYLI